MSTQSKKKHKPVKELFALYTNSGELFDIWTTLEDAEIDAVGPAFRPTFKIQRFVPDGKPKRRKYR